MTTDSQTANPANDTPVTDPSEILKETSRTLKQLIESQVSLPAEIAKEARKELAVLENNASDLLQNDFDDARDNMMALIEQATKTLRDVIVLAGSVDTPSGYEVVAQFIKVVADLNKDILELHDRRENVKAKLAKGATTPAGGSSITNNNVFVGTPQEFLEMMKQAGIGMGMRTIDHV